ncbi:MAG: DEAD/DEAH box helicase [Synergistota bacterium]|nr:DEAD/DEAH box helicase [Synergistota bacterium]
MTNETCTAFFEGIGANLAQRLEERGFTSFTPVQEEVLKLEDRRCDMIVRAKTGSGKTLAFLLPLYDEGRLEKGSPRILILSPTRELAQQTAQEAKWLAHGLDIVVATLVGGMDMSAQIRDLRRGASVIVGTPGRTLDHLRKGTLDMESVHTVVLDEGDQMLDMGFRDELEAILDAATSRERTWLFSATMPLEMRKLLKKYLEEPRFLSLVEEGQQHSEIRHKVYQVPHRRKIEGLINILLWENPKKGLIFCHTKAETADVSRRLSEEGFAAMCLNGDMTQRERNTVLSAFRKGHIALLVATNVAARGLDVPEIDKVFQLGLPDDVETFTHRSGRTGRAGERGENAIILSPQEALTFKTMLRQTSIEVEWLDAPDSEDIRHRQREMEEHILLGGSEDKIGEDLLEWARRLLETEEPEVLVSRLLEKVDSHRPTGYALKEELRREQAHRSSRSERVPKADDREARVKSRGPATPVRMALKSSREWNVGRVLSGICNALNVSGKDVSRIKIRGDSVQIELSPEALKKYKSNSAALEKWGFAKMEAPAERSPKPYPKSDKRERRRITKDRKDRQKAY